MTQAISIEQLAACGPAVRGVLLRLLRDPALADDLLQESLLRAARSLGGLRGEASPATWLTAIALNVARDHLRSLRHRGRSVAVEDAGPIPAPGRPDSELLTAEMSGCILGHVTRLPERQRQAVLLHHFAGLDHRRIAASLGISEGNARVVLHRGMLALRTSLGRECRLDFTDEIPCEQRA